MDARGLENAAPIRGNSMTTSFRLLFVWLILVAFTPQAQDYVSPSPEKVRIGIFKLEPFMMTLEDKTAGGAVIDFWREFLAPRMGIEIEVSGPYPIPRLEQMLETGEVDIIPYITKIPSRESRFLYPPLPLTSIASCIIVRRDSPLQSVESAEDLFGLKIGFLTNAYVPPLLRHEKITLDLITATDFRYINHQKLMHGRVDALLDINHLSFIYEMNRHGYLKELRIIPLKQDLVSVYSIFTRTPRGESLKERYNSALNRVPQGSLDVIIRRYLDDPR